LKAVHRDRVVRQRGLAPDERVERLVVGGGADSELVEDDDLFAALGGRSSSTSTRGGV
jgi:hypothetical protein